MKAAVGPWKATEEGIQENGLAKAKKNASGGHPGSTFKY